MFVLVAGMHYIFAGTRNCDIVHGILYSCLRALFGISVVGILVCIFSCMLVYQLQRYVTLPHIKKFSPALTKVIRPFSVFHLVTRRRRSTGSSWSPDAAISITVAEAPFQAASTTTTASTISIRHWPCLRLHTANAAQQQHTTLRKGIGEKTLLDLRERDWCPSAELLAGSWKWDGSLSLTQTHVWLLLRRTREKTPEFMAFLPSRKCRREPGPGDVGRPAAEWGHLYTFQAKATLSLSFLPLSI